MTALQKLPLPVNLAHAGYALYMAEGVHPEKWSRGALLDALYLHTGRTYTPSDVVRVPHEKPYLQDGSTEFSVTHSGEVWMVCIGPRPMGLDLQIFKEKYSPGVAKRYFHPEELALLEAAEKTGEDVPLFFRIWCARESYAKFTGDGVAGMDKAYSTLHSPVPLYHMDFRPGYALTLCTDFKEI